MKSCPKCNRTYPDDGQKFCTFDGGLLIAPQTFDPNATIRATSLDLNASAERPTSRDLPDPNATIIENYPATVALPRNTGPTTGPTGSSPDTAGIGNQATPPPVTPTPPPPPPPPPAVEPTAATIVDTVPPAVAQPPAPSAPLPPPVVKKKSKMPWIIAGVLLFLLLGGGALAGIFFFVVKPRLDEMSAQQNTNTNREIENTNTNTSTPTPTASVEAPSPTPEETFVPPPGAIAFVNSNASLDGRLAEHYLDFHFYYPEGWTRDPKSGVKGASNFVKVDRLVPPDFTKENFAVGWYTSTGTFVGDLPSYPERVAEFSNSLAKTFPGYRKVLERPTTVNSLQGYEFRWEGLAKNTDHGDLKLWGRVIFLPTGKEGDTTGATLTMFCTSLAEDLSSVEDVGVKGESPLILESFRFGKKQ